MQLLVGHDDAVASWMGEQLSETFVPPFGAIGVLDEQGTLRGGWLVNGYNGFNADLTIYGPRMLNRSAIRACYSHLFGDLKVLRTTAFTRRDNAIMRNLLPRLGFVFEGLRRRYYGPHRRDDAFTYALFRDTAMKWIEKHGLIT